MNALEKVHLENQTGLLERQHTVTDEVLQQNAVEIEGGPLKGKWNEKERWWVMGEKIQNGDIISRGQTWGIKREKARWEINYQMLWCDDTASWKRGGDMGALSHGLWKRKLGQTEGAHFSGYQASQVSHSLNQCFRFQKFILRKPWETHTCHVSKYCCQHELDIGEDRIGKRLNKWQTTMQPLKFLVLEEYLWWRKASEYTFRVEKQTLTSSKGSMIANLKKIYIYISVCMFSVVCIQTCMYITGKKDDIILFVIRFGRVGLPMVLYDSLYILVFIKYFTYFSNQKKACKAQTNHRVFLPMETVIIKFTKPSDMIICTNGSKKNMNLGFPFAWRDPNWDNFNLTSSDFKIMTFYLNLCSWPLSHNQK